MCRLALVAPTAMHKQGFHPTAICGTFGVTAGIASVLNLSDKQFASALGIAGSLSSGIIEYLAEGTSTKRLHPGWATSSGMQAAMIAKNNFAGPRTVFEGDHGFFNSFAKKDIDRNFNELTNDLGKVYHVKNLAFKPFACGTMTQPFIDCAIRLKEKIGDISKIKRIKALVGEGTVHRLWEPISEKRNPSSAYSAKFSTPYCIAIGLLKGKAGLAEFDENNINDQEILKLTQIIEYEIDPDDEYPKNYSGTLVVETEEGQIIEKQACLRGGKKQPLVFKDIDQKFNDNLSFGKLNNDETKKLNIFIESFFDKPDYSKINLF
jgi:2-methylcitrate dehydratase PrpD